MVHVGSTIISCAMYQHTQADTTMTDTIVPHAMMPLWDMPDEVQGLGWYVMNCHLKQHLWLSMTTYKSLTMMYLERLFRANTNGSGEVYYGLKQALRIRPDDAEGVSHFSTTSTLVLIEEFVPSMTNIMRLKDLCDKAFVVVVSPEGLAAQSAALRSRFQEVDDELMNTIKQLWVHHRDIDVDIVSDNEDSEPDTSSVKTPRCGDITNCTGPDECSDCKDLPPDCNECKESLQGPDPTLCYQCDALLHGPDPHDVLCDELGDDYYSEPGDATAHTSQTSARGRIVNSENLPDTELDENEIKAVTGGGKIAGRVLFDKQESFDTNVKFIITCNAELPIRYNGKRRFITIDDDDEYIPSPPEYDTIRERVQAEAAYKK
jgi:hypothetical protein